MRPREGVCLTICPDGHIQLSADLFDALGEPKFLGYDVPHLLPHPLLQLWGMDQRHQDSLSVSRPATAKHRDIIYQARARKLARKLRVRGKMKLHLVEGLDGERVVALEAI